MNSPIEIAATYAAESNVEPWSHFASAKQMIDQRKPDQAVTELRKVLEIKNLDARVYLQAWHCLRTLGVLLPKEITAQIKGMVVEAALDQGLDLVAAYIDHSARYYNYSGAGIVWDISDPAINQIIDDLLKAGQEIINRIGLWDQPRPPAPPKGSVRINLLTFGGLYFGQASFETMASDPIGDAAFNLALKLMQALIERTKVA